MGKHSLLHTLRSWSYSRVQFPRSATAAEALAQVAERRHSAIASDGNRLIGLVDGKAFASERAGDEELQELRYSGEECQRTVACIFLFDGTIAAAHCNYLGTAVHDSTICRQLDLEARMRHLDSNFVVAGDSAFSAGGRMVQVLSRPELDELPDGQWEHAASLNYHLARLRVSAGWGLGCLVKAWRALLVPTASNDTIGPGLVAELCFRLHNLRARLLHRRQITPVYCADVYADVL